MLNHTHVLPVPLPQTILSVRALESGHHTRRDADFAAHRARQPGRFAAVATYQQSDDMLRELAVELASRKCLSYVPDGCLSSRC